MPDGAYLSMETKLKDNLETDTSKNRMTHILGRYEGRASEYYTDFQSNDEAFMSQPLKYMSKLTHNILGAIDYERVWRVRNENYDYLDSNLSGYNKLELVTCESAFAYPFYAKNSFIIRKQMAKKKLYIPMLWPNVLGCTPEGTLEQDYAANILPLPCDQRYGLKDMDTIIKALLEFY